MIGVTEHSDSDHGGECPKTAIDVRLGVDVVKRRAGTSTRFRDGFGTWIEAIAGDFHQVENVPLSGYFSQNDPRPHFGLGQHNEIDPPAIR